jgi:hypothetical protein
MAIWKCKSVTLKQALDSKQIPRVVVKLGVAPKDPGTISMFLYEKIKPTS